MSTVRRRAASWRKLLVAAIIAVLAFAATASASWNGLVFPRNGQFYATPGTYYNTPEWVYAQQTGGPCSNLRVQLRRVSNGQVIFDAQPAAPGCPYGHTIAWQYRTTEGPDYPGGVRIWIVAGPADGQNVAAWVCGGGPVFWSGC